MVEVEEPNVFDTVGAGRFLGLARSTMERMRIEGGGPVFAKLGGVVRYCRSDLEAYRDSRKYGSTSEYDRRQWTSKGAEKPFRGR